MPKGVKTKTSSEAQLVENMIGLQRVFVGLADKINELSNQISGLLKLFESAAKSLSEQPAVQICGKDKELLEKLNQPLEQDKVIAKGITYIEDRMNEMNPEANKAHPLEGMQESPQAAPEPSPDKVVQKF